MTKHEKLIWIATFAAEMQASGSVARAVTFASNAVREYRRYVSENDNRSPLDG
jgi:hypothetical protein